MFPENWHFIMWVLWISANYHILKVSMLEMEEMEYILTLLLYTDNQRTYTSISMFWKEHYTIGLSGLSSGVSLSSFKLASINAIDRCNHFCFLVRFISSIQYWIDCSFADIPFSPWGLDSRHIISASGGQ